MKNIYLTLIVILVVGYIKPVTYAKAGIETNPEFHVKFDAESDFLTIKMKHSSTKTLTQARNLYKSTSYFKNIHQFFPCGKNDILLKIEELKNDEDYRFEYFMACKNQSKRSSKI